MSGRRTYYVIDWIRQVPKGYVGMPQLATAEKGHKITEATADACARIVRQIKEYVSPCALRLDSCYLGQLCE
ncbi:MAG: hypothetical protein ACUVWR_04155 [Anaerolineae bacterium]